MSYVFGFAPPIIGSIIGAAFVFCGSNKFDHKKESIINGFASGVMIAASIFSLILPAITMEENVSIIKLFFITISFNFGFLLLLYIEKILGKYYKNVELNERETFMMFLVITLHNIPEGIAVGVVLAMAMIANTSLGMIAAISLSIGIAIQNIPETTVVSMKYKQKYGKFKSFWIGVLSGIVEPIAGVITLFFANFFQSTLPLFLTFAAGAMFFAVIAELIPSIAKSKYKNFGIVSFNIGFFIMMSLDIMLQ